MTQTDVLVRTTIRGRPHLPGHPRVWFASMFCACGATRPFMACAPGDAADTGPVVWCGPCWAARFSEVAVDAAAHRGGDAGGGVIAAVVRG